MTATAPRPVRSISTRQRRAPQQVGLAAPGVDTAQQLKQIVLVRRAAQPRPEVVRQRYSAAAIQWRRQFGGNHLRVHISVLLPMRACQWAISPRCWLESVISVKVFIATSARTGAPARCRAFRGCCRRTPAHGPSRSMAMPREHRWGPAPAPPPIDRPQVAVAHAPICLAIAGSLRLPHAPSAGAGWRPCSGSPSIMLR